ncbi:NAD-glutamate dehydrogenase [Kordiimonas aquimaris]|uniref:NAD-glutamate dehydrogenase n=1 Tax=Kordiimonas aquimaris TaxID=707591 RepID=UPI0021D3BB16|nr:NAD-glutamate dehydrogenase [Kordiimonas aquimaris]
MSKQNIVDHLAAAFTKMIKDTEKGSSATELKAFLDELYSLAAPDDLLMREPKELFSIGVNLWRASEKRKPGTAIVTVAGPQGTEAGADNTTRHSTIMIINDDMPFLVDSVTGCLSSSMHYRIHMMHHPIIDLPRDKAGKRSYVKGTERVRESYMYVEVSAQSDPKALENIKTTLEKTLEDVRAAVGDWRAMLAKIDETVASLTVNPPPIAEEQVGETINFLRWLGSDHFTFLGFREYRFDGDPAAFDFNHVDGTALGILRDPDRYVLRGKDGLTPMSAEIRHFLTQPDPVIITKANVKSTVHRVSHLDYIGVKIFDGEGNAIGERRFVGLFTSLSYSQFAHDVPLIRNKVANIQKRARLGHQSFAGKALSHILENFPRDELFQVEEDWLYDTALGVLQLTERPRPRAFIRPDQFGRFVSALVYVPRENYHSGLRTAIADILCESYKGEVSVYYAKLSEEALARWHFIIRTTPGDVPTIEEADIQQQIVEAAQGWDDRLHLNLIAHLGEEQGNRLHHDYKVRFTAAYREFFTPAQAAYDVIKLEEIDGEDDLRVDFYHHLADGENRFRLKIYHGSTLIALSRCMPVLENIGFSVLSEHSYKMGGGSQSHIHDFSLELETPCPFEMDQIKPLVEHLFLKVWRGASENDGFNELVLTSAMNWSEIVVLRAYGKYLRQLGMGYTPDYIADTMVEHSAISTLLLELFTAQFDPEFKDKRDDCADKVRSKITVALERVKSLDHDRILRAYVNVISATQRTNYYQDGVVERVDERALAFKIRSRDVEEAPLPKPFAEIWVYSPQVEGVHLRGGPIARGGLRWSDRREDFRTEVLGLVKAQQVKNAVIVPQGSKGGFYPKQLPTSGDRDAFLKEGVASYRSFITSLLSLTDNLKGGKTIAPKQIVRRDGNDPYLVVAADKGTATFSDIANGISEGRDFWLGDAFASGGSAGYDHKKMGITAKGGWVSVQRLFRERGVNVQKDEFTVIGVGDMAGDVFGNGMLLSKKIRLQAAFNHMHIFIDPNPGDTGKAWTERKRLFETPGTTWDDYDKKLISKGGGVFSRAEKSIKLSAEIKKWLGTEENSLSPVALINRILKAEADLLWFGGIGTYVRAPDETDLQVGDRANDALRVTSEELRVKVIGEGGNLGMTQRARIAYARLGGRLNTDFIDNSAGVDCSDKEVNIKILLTDAIAKGSLKKEDRNALLEVMTDEVSDIVLSDNYLQTQAISLAEASAANARQYHLGLIRALERTGGLNREIEFLPSDEGFSELAANDEGLTRPEIATLMAYAKMSLFDTLVKSDLIDDPVLQPELEWGFPSTLRERFATELRDHQLRREIIATVLANEVVNWAGLTFVYEVKEETGLGVEDIVAAFVIVREVFGLQEQWEAINALDYKVPASVQYDMHQSVSDSLKTQVLWMLRNLDQPFNVSALVERFKTPFEKLFGIKQEVLSTPAQAAFVGRRDTLKGDGVDHGLATFVAAFEVLASGPDIIMVAEECGKPVDYVAGVHFALGDLLNFDWLRQRADRIASEDHWEMLATRAILEDLADQQRDLVHKVCSKADKMTVKQATGAWRKEQATRLIRADRLAEDLLSSGGLSVAKLSFAARHLRSILR